LGQLSPADFIDTGNETIPEPSTLAIWALGLLTLFGWRRRR